MVHLLHTQLGTGFLVVRGTGSLWTAVGRENDRIRNLIKEKVL